MNIALERLFVKYIIYVYIQSFLYILCLGTIPILRQLKDWVGEERNEQVQKMAIFAYV